MRTSTLNNPTQQQQDTTCQPHHVPHQQGQQLQAMVVAMVAVVLCVRVLCTGCRCTWRIGWIRCVCVVFGGWGLLLGVGSGGGQACMPLCEAVWDVLLRFHPPLPLALAHN